MPFNWKCPFCGHHTTITNERKSEDHHHIHLESTLGDQALHTMAIACPNDACKELYITASMGGYSHVGAGQYRYDKPTLSWKLRPQGAVKPFPDYIPAPIRQDYEEACRICDLSPKASATLSRRCLQGMIRDFWKVKKRRLIDEVRALEGCVPASTWKAIDSVREIGNIGAHMEKDINLVIDVDPREAMLLIELIENLIEDWYVERHRRDSRMDHIVATANAKSAAKKKPVASAEAADEPAAPSRPHS